MNSNTIVAIIVGLVVLGGGAFLFMQGDNESVSQGNGEVMEEENVDSDVPESFSGSLAGLFAFGQNVTCTFEQSDEQAEGGGTVYISGDRMRGDFTMKFKEDGSTMRASTIQKDETIYSWGDSPFGSFATKVAVQEGDAVGGSSDDSSPVDYNDELDYSCKKWKVDNSKFDLPNDVTFDDINAQIQQINEATGNMLDLQCSACDDIPDANAQAQCRAALGC